MRLPLGFADSASAPSAARSRPSKLLLLLFLLNREFEFSSINANVASSSDNNEGQLSSKCLNASDFITAANNKEFYSLNTSTYSTRKIAKQANIPSQHNVKHVRFRQRLCILKS